MTEEITPQERKALSSEILGYIDTDLICYITDEPEVYATAQKDAWEPVLNWIEKFLGIKPLTTTGLTALTQPDGLHRSITGYIENLNDRTFLSFYKVTKATGSVFLGLAFLEQAFSNDEIFHAALIEDLTKDNIYLADQYGLSPDQERKRAFLEKTLEESKQALL